MFSTGIVGAAAGVSYKNLVFKYKYSYEAFLTGTEFIFGLTSKNSRQINRDLLFNAVNGNNTTVVS